MLNRLYVTYIKRKKPSEEIYSGRASGIYDDETDNIIQEGLNILATRDRSHHKNTEGYEPAEIDNISKNSDATKEAENKCLSIIMEGQNLREEVLEIKSMALV